MLLFLAYTQLFRYLGPYNSGQYQFVLSYVLIFAVASDFGILQFITKKMSEDPGGVKKYFKEFLLFECAVSAVLYGALLSIAYFRHLDPVVFKAIAVAGLGMAANALTYPFLAVMTWAQDLRKVALINFLNSCVNVAVIFLAIYFKKHIVFLASVQLCFGILDLILYKIFTARHLASGPVRPAFGKLTVILDIFRQGWPFALLVGFSAIYNRIDIVIIAKLLGYAQTGLYTAAYKFFDLLNFFPASVSHVLFPVLAGLMAKKFILEVKASLEKYLKLMIAVALPVAVGGTILSKQLIKLVAGEEFLPAAPILSVLIWAAAILFIYIPLNSLVISQLTKKAAAITGINVLLNITGNLILIPIIGIKGAAIMTVASELFQGIFYFYFVRKNITRFRFFSILRKPALAAALMGLALWMVRDAHLIIALSAGAVIYATILLVLGFFGKEDIRFFKPLLKN